MTAALERGEWSAAHPGRTLPPGKTRYPFYRRLGGPKGRSERAENLVPTGIRSRTVQPLVNRYTDWTTRPTSMHITVIYFLSELHTGTPVFVHSPSLNPLSHACCIPQPIYPSRFIHLNPKLYYMYQRFSIQKFCIQPTMFLRVLLWISEQTNDFSAQY